MRSIHIQPFSTFFSPSVHYPYGYLKTYANYKIIHYCYFSLHVRLARGIQTVVLTLWDNLDSILAIGLPLYSILLLTMCWRAIALLFVSKDTCFFFQHKPHTHSHDSSLIWNSKNFMSPLFCSRSVTLIPQSSMNILRIICAVASILFVMSDTMIAINKFYTPISNSSVGIEARHKKLSSSNRLFCGKFQLISSRSHSFLSCFSFGSWQLTTLLNLVSHWALWIWIVKLSRNKPFSTTTYIWRKCSN